MIHVIPELATYPSVEEEFVKATQDLLDQGIFQQMIDSKQNIHFRKTENLPYWNPLQPDDKLSAPKSSLGLTRAEWRKIN